MDAKFAATHKLPFRDIDPLPLTLIDGTVNQNVTRIITLLIQLICSYSCAPEFYLTQLDRTSQVVLGHNWLSSHNPYVDWKEGTLTFPQAAKPTDPAERETNTGLGKSRDPPQQCPSIALINAIAY